MKYYVIDVFTDKAFGGNPAGVCLLDRWLPDDVLQNIAIENNLSETAFLVKSDGYYDLRWFTPGLEVVLCGHATLASASILFEDVEREADRLEFKTLSGVLTVTKENGMLYMDLPSKPVSPRPVYGAFEKAFGFRPSAAFKALDFLVLADSEETVRNLKPDFFALRQLKAEAGIDDDDFGTIVTAAGSDCDFVCRFFAPDAGIDEDPVTGRAYCSLTPFWSERLNKSTLLGRQISRRGGVVYCVNAGVDRVKIGGHMVKYLSGNILV